MMRAVMLTKFVEESKNRRYLIEDALNTNSTVMNQWSVLSIPWYKIFHNSKFNPNSWHRKNLTRYKWLRDRDFHASLEEATIVGANLWWLFQVSLEQDHGHLFFVQQMQRYYGSIFWEKFKRKNKRGSWIWNRTHCHIGWLLWDSSKFHQQIPK